MKLCRYYQAKVVPQQCWFFVGALRSFEHICFDRTQNVENSIFEFFVPQAQEQDFLAIMQHFEQQGIVSDVVSLPNRLEDPTSQI